MRHRQPLMPLVSQQVCAYRAAWQTRVPRAKWLPVVPANSFATQPKRLCHASAASVRQLPCLAPTSQHPYLQRLSSSPTAQPTLDLWCQQHKLCNSPNSSGWCKVRHMRNRQVPGRMEPQMQAHALAVTGGRRPPLCPPPFPSVTGRDRSDRCNTTTWCMFAHAGGVRHYMT